MNKQNNGTLYCCPRHGIIFNKRKRAQYNLASCSGTLIQNNTERVLEWVISAKNENKHQGLSIEFQIKNKKRFAIHRLLYWRRNGRCPTECTCSRKQVTKKFRNSSYETPKVSLKCILVFRIVFRTSILGFESNCCGFEHSNSTQKVV
jgi:hypothetical protein